MLSLLDVAERTQRGPRVGEKDWDMGLFRLMGELVQKYELQYPGDGVWFNTDDSVADRAFAAAVEFLTTRGAYCLSSGRVVEFTKQEVLQAAREAPREIVVGEGRDARVIKQRRIEEREGLNHVPAHHAPFSEEMAPLCVQNFARLPSGDYIEGFNFALVDGREIFGMPLEAYAARRQLAWLREGVRKAGRPGMAVSYYPINTRAATLIAPMDPDFGLRRTDGVILGVLPDMKIEQDMLTAAIVYEDYGCFKISAGGSAMVGGFCGGVAGAVIEATAKAIAAWIVYRDHIHQCGISHVQRASDRFTVTQPELTWAVSVTCQALNWNTGCILYNGGYTASGPGSESYLFELALIALKVPINGCNLMFPRQTRARINGAQTPLDAQWQWEIVQAVMKNGLTRADADSLSRKIAERLASMKPEPSQDVREVYDWVRHQPRPAYNDIYLRVKDQIAAMGLNFD